MATQVINHTYKLKGGEEDAVVRSNPFLERREPIVVYCNDGKTRMKVGDGVHHYNDLEFIGGSGNDAVEIIIDDKLSFESTNVVQNKVVTEALYNKVDKVHGKGLSTNDFTSYDKEKLSKIQEGATKVIVDSVNLNEYSTNAISNGLATKAINNLTSRVSQVETNMEETVTQKVNQIVDDKFSTVNFDGGEI